MQDDKQPLLILEMLSKKLWSRDQLFFGSPRTRRRKQEEEEREMWGIGEWQVEGNGIWRGWGLRAWGRAMALERGLLISNLRTSSRAAVRLKGGGRRWKILRRNPVIRANAVTDVSTQECHMLLAAVYLSSASSGE